MNNIKLKSRYNQIHHIKQINDYTYKASNVSRYGFEDDGTIIYIDFDGGPLLLLGDKLNDEIITSFERDNAHTILIYTK